MILVTGATGNVGAETVRLLAGQRQRVRVLVRDPSRLQHERVEVVTGDFDDPDFLDAAMRTVDTVVLISPGIPRQEIAAIDAAARARVRQVIKATSKASADSPVERRRGQTEIEQHLQVPGPRVDTASLECLPTESARLCSARPPGQRVRDVRRRREDRHGRRS